MIEAKCGTKHAIRAEVLCREFKRLNIKAKDAQSEAQSDGLCSNNQRSRWPASWQFAAAFHNSGQRACSFDRGSLAEVRSAMPDGSDLMGVFLRCALKFCSRIWLCMTGSWNARHTRRSEYDEISMANQSNHGRGIYAYSKLPPSCSGGCWSSK